MGKRNILLLAAMAAIVVPMYGQTIRVAVKRDYSPITSYGVQVAGDDLRWNLKNNLDRPIRLQWNIGNYLAGHVYLKANQEIIYRIGSANALPDKNRVYNLNWDIEYAGN